MCLVSGMSNPQKRHWMVTIWPQHLDLEDCSDTEIIDAYYDYWDRHVRFAPNLLYAVAQIERSPETGNLHIQGYTEWKSSKRRNEVSKLITGHLEYRKGSREDARDYCRKKIWKGKDKGQVKKLPVIGEWRQAKPQSISPKQRVLNLLRLGFAPEEIMVRDPEGYFTHYRAIDHMYNTLMKAGISLLTSGEEE